MKKNVKKTLLVQALVFWYHRKRYSKEERAVIQKRLLNDFNKKMDHYADRINEALYYSDDDHEDL